jgi:hypothetical protein
MATENPGIKRYMLLGKLVEQRHPDLASTLLSEINKSQPTETDMTKIGNFYRVFCHHNSMIKKQPYQKGQTTEIMYKRRIFIAVMLHIYSPGTYHQPPEFCSVTKGLTAEITVVLGIARSWVSKLYREVIVMEKVYDDFRQKVEDNVLHLTDQKPNSNKAQC